MSWFSQIPKIGNDPQNRNKWCGVSKKSSGKSITKSGVFKSHAL